MNNKNIKYNYNKIYSYVIKKGIKIYPIYNNGNWYIEVVNNKKPPKRFNKPISHEFILTGKVLLPYLNKTYIYYYNKLKNL